jgi:Transposase DDE domain
MYLRTISRRNKDGSTVRYLQLAHNVRNGKGNAVAGVVHSFGREDELDREALARLVRSISRFLDPEQALHASAGTELAFIGSRPYGGAFLLDALWRRLGIDKALTQAATGRKLSPAVERLIFTLVANRALDPSSKRHALEWAAQDVALPDAGDLGADPQVFYRAMDFLLDADPAIQEHVFFAVANLLNLEVDVLLFDTTSTYFETEADDQLRTYGHSKDHRGDRPQVVIGLAITKEGLPVRIWCWPGNASDKTVIRQVHDELRAWSLHRVLWVGDAGFTSKDNRTYLQRAGGQVLFAEKLRQGNDNHAALARPGRYQIVDDNLHVKEVHVGEGTAARRFVVCRNLAEATRDAARRDQALARLRDELAAIDAKTGDPRLAAEGELLANPTLRRYLTRRNTKLVIDTAKVTAERRLDGKFLLSATDPTIPAADLARLYKSLLDVERCWRDLKQVIDIRPVYHHKDDRIRAHVLLCFLALIIVRVAENATGLSWTRIRAELQRMHLGEFTGAAGHVSQRTETSPTQRDIFHALKIKEPPMILHHASP